MKVVARVLFALFSALSAAAALLFVFTRLDEAWHMLPALSSDAGEDDFSRRADAFFFVLVPAFAAMSGVFGWLAPNDFRRSLRGWCGLLVGSALFLAIAKLASSAFEEMATTSTAASRVFYGLVLTWVALAGCAALLMSKRKRPEPPGRDQAGQNICDHQ